MTDAKVARETITTRVIASAAVRSIDLRVNAISSASRARGATGRLTEPLSANLRGLTANAASAAVCFVGGYINAVDASAVDAT